MFLALTTALLAASPPEVAVLATEPMGELTELRFQRVGAKTLAPVAARLRHLEGSTVLGALLPGTHVVLTTATAARSRDESFASVLSRLEPGKPTVVLADRVAISTRPLVTPEGKVFVQRGVAGPESEQGAWRLDALTLDEVDPASGRTRTVLSAQAWLLFLAGHLGRELVVYRVDPAGARLVAVHTDTLAERVLGAVPDTARDFVVDEPRGRVLFTAADAVTKRWHVFSLDLAGRGLSKLAEGPSMALLPLVLPDGRVALAPGEGRGLVEVRSGATVLAAQGPGYERVRFVVNGLALGLHEVPSGLPRPLAVSLKDGAAQALLAPADQRLDLAGVGP